MARKTWRASSPSEPKSKLWNLQVFLFLRLSNSFHCHRAGSCKHVFLVQVESQSWPGQNSKDIRIRSHRTHQSVGHSFIPTTLLGFGHRKSFKGIMTGSVRIGLVWFGAVQVAYMPQMNPRTCNVQQLGTAKRAGGSGTKLKSFPQKSQKLRVQL